MIDVTFDCFPHVALEVVVAGVRSRRVGVTPPSLPGEEVGGQSFQGEMVLKVFRFYSQKKTGQINELVRLTSLYMGQKFFSSMKLGWLRFT